MVPRKPLIAVCSIFSLLSGIHDAVETCMFSVIAVSFRTKISGLLAGAHAWLDGWEVPEAFISQRCFCWAMCLTV